MPTQKFIVETAVIEGQQQIVSSTPYTPTLEMVLQNQGSTTETLAGIKQDVQNIKSEATGVDILNSALLVILMAIMIVKGYRKSN